MIEDLKDLASDCFLTQMVLEPTHRWVKTLHLLFTNNLDILHSYTSTETVFSEQFIIEGSINYKSNADPVEDPQNDAAVLGAVLEKLNLFSHQTDWIRMNSNLALINWQAEYRALTPIQMITKFIKICSDIAQIHAPHRKGSHRKSQN